jgi:hypothetical protein
VTGAGSVATRPTTRRSPRPAVSWTRRIGRLAARTVAILVVAGLIIAGATAVGYSPLGSRIPGTFLRFGEQRQGPPPGVTQGDQASGAAPQARGPQGGRIGGGQPGAGQGLFTGRNAPSLQRGLPEELSYLAIFAVLTAAVALALRLARTRRGRSTRLRLARNT